MNQNPYSYRQCSLIHYPCSWVCKSFCSSENKKWSTLKTALPSKFNLSGFMGRLFLYLILHCMLYSLYVFSVCIVLFTQKPMLKKITTFITMSAVYTSSILHLWPWKVLHSWAGIAKICAHGLQT